MGKFQNLIDNLFVAGKINHSNYQALVHANKRATPILEKALISNPDSDIREACAEIFGERGDPVTIPTLIRALKDECLFVRHDALWSIEKICRIQICGLNVWLDLDFENPDELHEKVSFWWSVNRQFIVDNKNFR